MLGKLIKHEFKATAKLLLPLLAAVLALMGGFQVIFLVVKLLTGRNDSHPLVAVLLPSLPFWRHLPCLPCWPSSSLWPFSGFIKTCLVMKAISCLRFRPRRGSRFSRSCW